VKNVTRTFYESAVLRTIHRIAATLDDALDLEALARAAALSPFHFHRVFRGMVDETPLEMHRRLRLERAAYQLLTSDVAVTTIAFGAGFETHEAFTRAFREAFGASPSAFRLGAVALQQSCGRTPQTELAAKSGVHFHPSNDGQAMAVAFITGAPNMKVDFEELPELRVAAVHHVGPYSRIAQAFAQLGALAAPAGLLQPSAMMLAIYHDDPETTPAEQLQSDAGITVASDVAMPTGLTEIRLPAGYYARTTHVGPYSKLGDAWARFMGDWLPKSGHRVGMGSSFEVYRNNPSNAAPEELRTELYLPIEKRT
jgi:AraC family transcriptional regulator